MFFVFNVFFRGILQSLFSTGPRGGAKHTTCLCCIGLSEACCVNSVEGHVSEPVFFVQSLDLRMVRGPRAQAQKQ